MILLVILMIIGTVTAVVTETANETFFASQYVTKVLQQEQVMALADAMSAGIRELLSQDDGNVDYYGEYWSYPIPISLDGIDLTVEVEDEERYLNPNMLVENGKVNEKAEAVFDRLFDVTGLGGETLTKSIEDWMLPDSLNFKHEKFSTTEELELVDGVTAEIFNGTIEGGQFRPGLRSLLSVWTDGKVNINTASKWILMSLDKSIDENLADNIIEYRKKHPFKKVDDLINVEGMTSDIIYRIKPFVDVKSSYFLAKASVKTGGSTYYLYILFKRDGASLKEVWRKIR
ncbi:MULTISPECIES: type II secretion system minor pseudopilin [unclassified Desulfurobacterium]|uniref:general secretion pathway protein GspK n=1 Tax=Desulfurobacterium sp. TC5-1 TaxID=1158318 RepID=UPI0003B395C0|nr:helix-hairpin-helix domain-containing protein [Desulfurobacterium sp. TC5-1]